MVNRKRVYFKEDILNLLLDNYFFDMVAPSVDMKRLLVMYDICLYHFNKSNKSNKKDIKEVDKFFEKCLDTYDVGTWLRLAIERLSSMGFHSKYVLQQLQFDEIRKHGEEIEFVL